MTEEQLTFPLPVARRTDPSTSRAAAARVKAGNDDLLFAIRKLVRAHGPMSAFDIAEAVVRDHPGRWAQDTVRTACKRAGLEVCELTGLSPRGLRCALYVLREEAVTVRSDHL